METRAGRAPRGGRGLKPPKGTGTMVTWVSRPTWGAWIETGGQFDTGPGKTCRAPRGARGLKLMLDRAIRTLALSRPTWGAWIETSCRPAPMRRSFVAPHVGRVD